MTESTHIPDASAMFLLKRWRPEYRENFRVEHSGSGGGAIRIDIEKVDRDIRSLLEEQGS